MKTFRALLLTLTGILLFTFSVCAQTGVTVYNAPDFQGANMTLTQSWKGGNGFDRNIKSIRVPPGYRLTLYTEKNYKGTETRITED